MPKKTFLNTEEADTRRILGFILEPDTTIAQYIKAVGLTGQQIAVELQLNPTTVSSWISGKRNPEPHQVILLGAMCLRALERNRMVLEDPEAETKIRQSAAQQNIRIPANWRELTKKKIKEAEELKSLHDQETLSYGADERSKALTRLVELGYLTSEEAIKKIGNILSIVAKLQSKDPTTQLIGLSEAVSAGSTPAKPKATTVRNQKKRERQKVR